MSEPDSNPFRNGVLPEHHLILTGEPHDPETFDAFWNALSDPNAKIEEALFDASAAFETVADELQDVLRRLSATGVPFVFAAFPQIAQITHVCTCGMCAEPGETIMSLTPRTFASYPVVPQMQAVQVAHGILQDPGRMRQMRVGENARTALRAVIDGNLTDN